MNRNTTLGLSIAGAVLLYLGLSWGSGRMALAQLDGWREKAQAEFPIPILKITDRKVTGGLFSSTEEVTYEFSLEPFRRLIEKQGEEGMQPASDTPLPKPVHFTLRNTIQHGPLPGFSGFGMARIETTLVMDDETRQMLMTNIGTDKPLEATTRLGFLGGGTATLSSPAFQYTHKPTNMSFEWKGLESSFDFGRNMNSMDGTAKMPGLRMSGPASDGASTDALDLGEISMDVALERALGKLFTGKVSFAVAGFTATKGAGAQPVTAKDLRYGVDMALKDDHLDMIIKFGLGHLAFEKADVRDVHYDLSLRHLHAPTYAEFQERMQEQQWKVMTGDTAASIAFVGLIAEYGPKLLEHTPELAVDHLGFTLPEGTFKVSGKVSLPGFKHEDLSAGMPAMIGKIDASMDISVSQGLIDKDWGAGAAVDPGATALAEAGEMDPETGAPPPGGMGPGLAQLQALKAQTQALEEQGFIKRNGDSLESRIEFRNGALTVNGKPMGPPAAGVE